MLDKEAIKSAMEIGVLTSELTPANQSYVLNTIMALLFAQECQKEKSIETLMNLPEG